ncbi:carotenoid oxygenase [Haematococcus lacustris]
MVLDLPQRRLHSCQRLLRRTLEFPAINQGQATAQPYRHAYFAADAVDHGRAWGPAQVLLKASLPLVTSTDLTAVQQPAVAGVEGAGRGGNKGSRQQEPASAGVEDAAGVVTESWAPGPHCFVQEPFFVPRPGGMSEDDGWIIVGVHNAETRRGEVSILDAQCIGKGPLATLHLPHPLPMGLHGTWTSELLGRHPPPRPATDPGMPAAVPEPVTRLHQM